MPVIAYCIGCNKKCQMTAESEYIPSACLYGTSGARSRWYDKETIEELQKIEMKK